MAFGLGAALGGFAERTLQNRDRARQERREVLFLGLEQHRKNLEEYQSKRAARRARVDMAQTVIDTTADPFTAEQVVQAGNAVGWKSAAEVQKFLKESGNFKPAGAQRATLTEQTQALFGPEPEPPMPAIPTQEDRGLLDIFAPRTLPTVGEVQAVTGIPPAAPQQPQQQQRSLPGVDIIGEPVQPAPMGITPTPTGGLPRGLQFQVTPDQINQLEDSIRTDSAFADRRVPDNLVGQFNPVNTALKEVRTLALAEAEHQMRSEGVDSRQAVVNARNSFNNILNSPVFLPLEAQFDTPGFDPNTRVVTGVTAETEPLINEIGGMLLRHQGNPDLYELTRNTVGKLLDPQILNGLEEELNLRLIRNQLLPIQNTPGLSREQARSYFNQTMAGISNRRRSTITQMIRQVAEEAVTPEGFDPETQPTLSEELQERGVGQIPQEDRGFGQSVLEFLGGVAREAQEAGATVRQFGTDVAETIFGEDEQPVEETPETQPMSELEMRSRETLEELATDRQGTVKVLRRVFSEGPQRIVSMIDEMEPAAQFVTTSLLDIADQRDERFSPRARREISRVLREETELDNAVQYVQDNEGGFRARAYTDSLGNRTIGIGFNLEREDAQEILGEVVGPTRARNILRNGDEELSQEEGNELFAKSLATAEMDAGQSVNNFGELPKEAQVVLIDMSYNLGKTKLLQFDQMLRALEAEDYIAASEELLNSDYTFQVGQRAVKNAKILAGLQE